MPINPLNLPGQFQSPTVDFSSLANLGNVYRQSQQRQTLAELGRGLADGSVDYRTAAGQIAQTGDIDTSVKFLQLAEARKKQEDELAAGNSFFAGLNNSYGGGAGNAQQPAQMPTNPQSSGAIPTDPTMNVPARAPVQPTSRVWGDQEAENAGLYEPRSQPGQQPTTLASLGAASVTAGALPPSSSVGARPPEQQLAQAPQPAPQPTTPSEGGLSQRAMMLMQGAANPRLPQAHREMAKTMLAHELEATKATGDMREWAFAKAQDPTTPGFTDWVRGNKSAGKTDITIDNRAENEEAKASGKAAGDRRATMFASAGAAHKTLTNLSRVEGLLSQVSQGRMEPGRMTISAWGKAMGLNDDIATSLGLDPKGVGSAEALQALTSEMVIGKIGSGGFPANNFSDADRSFLMGTVQQLSHDPRANKIITETARRMANLDIERAKQYQTWKKDPANAKGSFEDFELGFSEKMARRDVFGDLRREAEGIIGAPRADIGRTYQNPGAAPDRGQGNNPPISVKSPEDARRLPPGTRFTTPDGREMVR